MGRYFRPATLDQATEALARQPMLIVAGGTDIYPAHVGKKLTQDILDLCGIEALTEITETGTGWLIGAGVTWRQIWEADLPPMFDGLRAAARDVGGWQVQNQATVVGNICNASPAADGVPPLLTLDAHVRLRSRKGERDVAISDFILGNRRTARQSSELVTGIFIPKTPGPTVSGFYKLGARRYLVISIVMAAAVLQQDEDGRITDARVAIGACSEVAQRLPSLEARLRGQPMTDLPRMVEDADFQHLSPIDDVRGTAVYRRDAAPTVVRRLLADLELGDG